MLKKLIIFFQSEYLELFSLAFLMPGVRDQM